MKLSLGFLALFVATTLCAEPALEIEVGPPLSATPGVAVPASPVTKPQVTKPAIRVSRLPLILVKGFGPSFATLVIFRKFLRNDGFRYSDLNVLEYPQEAAPDELRAKARESLQKIYARYPAGQQFDLITHSFGSFVGPYAAFSDVLDGRIRKWVSLAGMTQGQNDLPLCKGIFKESCGATLPQMIPFRSPLVLDFLKEADLALNNVDKCALYAPDDGRVNDPAESAVLSGTLAVVVEKATHNDFIWHEDVYWIMRHTCYGENLPMHQLAFDWHYQ